MVPRVLVVAVAPQMRSVMCRCPSRRRLCK
jgi:hypothetical protein